MVERFVTFIQPLLKYLPLLAQKKIFLYTVGVLCIIGVLSKWLVKSEYNGMIKKAKDMSSARNKTLRQIKIKFENCRQLTGQVRNSKVMVNNFLRGHRVFGMTLNGINKITDLCALLCVATGGIGGAAAYIYGNGKTMSAAYILIGCTLAFALEIFDKWSNVNYSHMLLVDIITDFLENVVQNPMESISKNSVLSDVMGDGDEGNSEIENVISSPQEEVASTAEKELLIEEVLSEFLE